MNYPSVTAQLRRVSWLAGSMTIDGTRQPAARHRPRRDQRVARQPRGRRRDPRQDPGAVPHRQAARAGQRAPGRVAGRGVHAVRQHHPRRAGAVVPRRRARRAPHPRLHPLERRRHGHQGQQEGRRHRRPPRHLRLVGVALRGRLQPLLPGQGRRHPRRPRVLPGPRRARHLRPGVPRGPAHRRAARRLPAGGRRHRHLVVPAPPPDARLLGVPHGLDGPRSDQLDLRGPLPQVPPEPTDRRHQPEPGVVLHRRRRDRRARDPRVDLARGPRGPRQPDLGRQLQPAASRRPGPRQRQDHPGARGSVPRGGLERHQGRVGLQVGRAAPARRRRRAAQQDEHHRRRTVPALRRRGRRVHPRRLLRPRPPPAEDGGAPLRRRHPQPAPRRSRLQEALRRLQGRHRDRGPPDRHPRQDHQGLDARRGRGGPQRHPPDQEDDRRPSCASLRDRLYLQDEIPEEVAHRRRRAALHHVAGGDARARVLPRSDQGARRRPPVAAGPDPQGDHPAERRRLHRAARRVGDAGGRHDDGLHPPAAQPRPRRRLR